MTKIQYVFIPAGTKEVARKSYAAFIMCKVMYVIDVKIESFKVACSALEKLSDMRNKLYNMSQIEAIKVLQDLACTQNNYVEHLFGEILMFQIENFK